MFIRTATRKNLNNNFGNLGKSFQDVWQKVNAMPAKTAWTPSTGKPSSSPRGMTEFPDLSFLRESFQKFAPKADHSNSLVTQKMRDAWGYLAGPAKSTTSSQGGAGSFGSFGNFGNFGGGGQGKGFPFGGGGGGGGGGGFGTSLLNKMLEMCSVSHARQTAQRMGMDLRDIKFTFNGQKVDVAIDAPNASQEQIEALGRTVQQECPVARFYGSKNLEMNWRKQLK